MAVCRGGAVTLRLSDCSELLLPLLERGPKIRTFADMYQSERRRNVEEQSRSKSCPEFRLPAPA